MRVVNERVRELQLSNALYALIQITCLTCKQHAKNINYLAINCRFLFKKQLFLYVNYAFNIKQYVNIAQFVYVFITCDQLQFVVSQLKEILSLLLFCFVS